MAAVKGRKGRTRGRLGADDDNDKDQNDDEEIELGYMGQELDSKSDKSMQSKNSYLPMVKASQFGISERSIDDDSLDDSNISVAQHDHLKLRKSIYDMDYNPDDQDANESPSWAVETTLYMRYLIK